jgi:hypothetical protein
MANRLPEPVPVLLKGTLEVVGHYAGDVPDRDPVLRWSDPEDPDIGIEALVLYDHDAGAGTKSPFDCPVKAILVASREALAGVEGFAPLAPAAP